MAGGADRNIDRRGFLKGASAAVAVAGAGGLLGACSSSTGGGTGKTNGPAPAAKVRPVIDGDITWYTTADYVPPKLVSQFESEHGVKIKQTFYSNQSEMVQKMAAGIDFDLITTDSAFMTQLTTGKLLQSFDINALKNFGEIAPYFQQPWWDATGDARYTVPYGYGPTGIYYRKDKIPSITNSWADMWDAADAAGHIYLLDSMGDTLGMALIRDGFDTNEGDSGHVSKATDDLIKLKPRVAKVTTNITPPVASGDAWLMEGWTTQVYQGIVQMKNPEVADFKIPEDGPLLACDTLSIGAHAKAPGTALLFIDWLLEESRNYELGKFALQKTGAKGGNAAFTDSVKDFPYFDFSDDILTPKQNWKEFPYGTRGQLWNLQWARFRA